MKKKKLPTEEVLKKVASWCAYQERSVYEVKKKLMENYELKDIEIEQIIDKLISQNFVNEERFAKAFAAGKFRIKKWGKGKIRQALQAYRIAEKLIQKALQEISDEEYLTTLQEILIKKNQQVNEKDLKKKKQKLAFYAINKGYESDIVWDIVETVLKG